MMSAIIARLESEIGVSVMCIATSNVYPTRDWARVQLWLLSGARLAGSGKYICAPKPDNAAFAPCFLV